MQQLFAIAVYLPFSPQIAKRLPKSTVLPAANSVLLVPKLISSRLHPHYNGHKPRPIWFEDIPYPADHIHSIAVASHPTARHPLSLQTQQHNYITYRNRQKQFSDLLFLPRYSFQKPLYSLIGKQNYRMSKEKGNYPRILPNKA